MKIMNRNLPSLNFCMGLFNKNYNYRQYETTYKSAYGNFCSEDNNIKENLRYPQKKSVNSKCKFLLLNQSKKEIVNSKLICPNCINENIVKMKSLSRSRIKRSKIEDGFFEDKMRSAHKYKLQKDIQNREDRAKKTYHSLFIHRGRSADYKKIYTTNNNDNSKEGEYFGKDVEYGMLRCRDRELKNNKKIFGIDLNEGLKTNKSWIGKNYLLDKDEYSQIINLQIEKNNKRNENKRYLKLKEENDILNEQIKNERNKINEENNKKNNIRNEMNRVNSALIKEKEKKIYNQKRIKRKEKECISNICKKEIEEFINNLKMKKIKAQNIDKDNYRSVQIKYKTLERKKKLKNDKMYYGLPLKGMENKKCDQCNRVYPKNVLSQIYCTYAHQQKK